ncbi:phenylalanine--tRNA ligase subunit beta [Leekyejoonella antrihumi]|uniref:Phenylalanine--tRNA ligase beta subunit n=1 Tax=Leekyejoonella antrihumi TaxID=1660198 RepID=A0A563DSX3_9MICO|nr:phenylalanine--tRNA ligase subunit beta [Leekyejoonella antrihumi]TWP33347.1 phenylalanine--tRNA ligase subunit beta [Leekyejoonella antrihumi]
MRVPVEWLREYVAVPKDARGVDVAASLVQVGLEEEGVHGGQVTGPLVVGKVLTLDPEPQKNGKTINWCSVDVGAANGTGEPQGIVCGAHNFQVDELVVVVLPGAELPGGFAISARKTYGHVSAGMICAADELGLPDDGSGGIIRLADLLPSADVKPGDDAIPLLGLDRETVEINVTPDRGYCFSLRGVAREYAHATGAEFTDPALDLAARAPASNEAGYEVRLEDDAPLRGNQGCDRYVARIVRGIDLTAATPAWLATRLTEAGMRPISLAVDVTNYVMLALGQPLHAFDVQTLQGPIVVRRARQGEKLKTLDDVERALYPEDLLITDGGDKALAIAGVMGGEDSEVTASTTDVLIESAHFDATTVARSSRRHKLPSEAARRFERGVDPQAAPAAAQLAVDLLVQLGGGNVDQGVTDVGAPPTPEAIELDPTLPSRLVGVDYSTDDVVGVLREIGCEVDTSGDALSVVPPSWRPDLHTAPDLVEEVARIKGYDRIPSILPTPPGGRGLTHGQRVRRVVADALAAQGLSEVWTAPFVSDERHVALGYDAEQARARTVRIANPLSEQQPLMRISVLSTLVDTLRRNISRGVKDVAIFELGLVLAREGEQQHALTSPVGVHPAPEVLDAIRAAVPPQPRHLAILLSGETEHAGWWGAGRPADWSDAVALVRSVGTALALEVSVRADDAMPFHPGRCACFALPDGTLVGHAGELHPKVCQALGLPARVVGAEIDVDVLIHASDQAVVSRPIATYPLVQSDVALVVDQSVTAAEVEAVLRSGAGDLLEQIVLFDTYQGDQVEDGKKSLAYRLSFRALDRTLTTQEVNTLRDRAVAAAGSATGAVQRT